MFHNARKFTVPAALAAAAIAFTAVPATAGAQTAPSRTQATTQQEQAAPAAQRTDRCAPRYVCLYRDRHFTHKTAQFNRVTGRWQRITPRQYWVQNNTRRNAVEFLLINNQRRCIPPHFKGKLEVRHHPKALRISRTAHCPR
ncbi:hypothetical protein [Streptomyces sulphureus]|uniref:hypothetical protein n=1 Tax=Streptomyces sulphureus TaxID=47758 RepID=UPI000381A56C|nr:hypothetical protein [Streptomyces sulphureus]